MCYLYCDQLCNSEFVEAWQLNDRADSVKKYIDFAL
jgi:hypothetical protein